MDNATVPRNTAHEPLTGSLATAQDQSDIHESQRFIDNHVICLHRDLDRGDHSSTQRKGIDTAGEGISSTSLATCVSDEINVIARRVTDVAVLLIKRELHGTWPEHACQGSLALRTARDVERLLLANLVHSRDTLRVVKGQ